MVGILQGREATKTIEPHSKQQQQNNKKKTKKKNPAKLLNVTLIYPQLKILKTKNVKKKYQKLIKEEVK